MYNSKHVASVVQLVRAPDCGSGCHRFESDYSPHLVFSLSVFLVSRFLCVDFFRAKKNIEI